MHRRTRSCVLYLWIHVLTFVKSQDCTLEQFLNGPLYDNSFDISSLDASYPAGKRVRVGCVVGYSGFFEMICVEGRWQYRGTKCEPIICRIPNIENGYVPPSIPADKEFREHEVLHYACNELYKRAEERPSKCTKLGGRAEFSPTPECEPIKCKLDLPQPQGTSYNPQYKNVFSPGERLTVHCGESHWISDPRDTSAEVTCKADGEWTITPVCQDAVGCGTPPFLADGDVKHTMKRQYNHSESVEYRCQLYYTMEGGPYKTCIDGEWTGYVRCLKPCIANEDDFIQHNITLKSPDKKFFAHDDMMEFMCARGTPVGAVAMRQRCNSGVILLPTCQ